MTAKRALLVVISFVIIAGVLAGCSAQAEDATFLGYKERPTNNTPGIAIVQLETGEPAEAECKYSTLENGVPIKVEKTGDGYRVVAVSPDWD